MSASCVDEGSLSKTPAVVEDLLASLNKFKVGKWERAGLIVALAPLLPSQVESAYEP